MKDEIQPGQAVLVPVETNDPKTKLKLLKEEAEAYLESFLAPKRKSSVTNYDERLTILNRAKERPEQALTAILNNYGFKPNNRFRNYLIPEISLPPILQKLAIVNGDCRYESGNFRDPNWVKTGCLGEMGFVHLMNCVFDFFQLDVRMLLTDTESLLYGGDSGSDFRLGTFLLDIKYRDDSPAKGMALQNKFLKSSLRDPESLLVQVSNTTDDKKLGHSVVNTDLSLIEKDLPLALVGYVSVADYEDRKKSFNGGYSNWIVDNLNPPSELIFRLVEAVNANEGMFEI